MTSSTFTLEEIAKILEMLRENGVTEFKLEREGEKISMKRGPEFVSVPTQPAATTVPSYLHNSVSPLHTAAESSLGVENKVTPLTVVEDTARKSNLLEVKSPMVGTFYRRPAVDAAPYVEVGQIVKKGDVLCIVEAMKLMNEIETDVAGRISEVRLEDGQMVEYGEVLFRIEPL